MRSIIVQLTTMAAMLRGIRNSETEAPRLFREYLEMVPIIELDALEDSYKSAIADAVKAQDEAGVARDAGDSKLQQFQDAYEKEIEAFDTLVANLRDELETAKSERSDTASPGDAGQITALQTALFEERARVKHLEAVIAATPAVKPLDAKPPGNANPPDPKARREAKREKKEVPFATAPPVLTRNEVRNGIELRFNGKPDDATREALTAAKWRWSPVQPGQPWYARYTEEQYLFAQSLATGSAYTPMPSMPETDAEPVAPAPVPPTPAAAKARRIILPDF